MAKIVRISDMSDDEKNKWKEQVNTRAYEREINRQNEIERVNKLFSNVNNSSEVLEEKKNKISNYDNLKKNTLKQIGNELQDKKKERDSKLILPILNKTRQININSNSLSNMDDEQSKVFTDSRIDEKILNSDKTNNKLLLPILGKSNKIDINSEQVLDDLSNMNNGKRVATIDSITDNKMNFNKLNLDAIQYKQNKEVLKESNKISEDINNGNYLSGVGHILNGVPQKALDTTATTFASMNSMVEPKKISNTQADDNELLKANRILSNKYEQTTANIDNDIIKTASGISGTIGQMTPAIIANTALPGFGTILQGVNVGGGAYQDTLDENASNKMQATITAITKGTASALIEKIFGGNILGKGSLDDTAIKIIEKSFKGKVGQKLASKAYEIIGEIGEENLENQVGYVIDKLVNNKELPNFNEWWNETQETSKSTFLTTIVLNMLGMGGNTYNDIQDIKVKSYLKEAKNIIRNDIINNQNISIDKKINYINELNNANTIQNFNNYLENNHQGQQTIFKQNQTNSNNILKKQKSISQGNKMSQNGLSTELNDILNNKQFSIQSFQYEKSENIKIDNLRKEANKYFNNSEQTKNFINMLERIITDKNVEIRLDSNLITKDGKVANGSYSDGVITVNPNSNRVGEFITIHELTHAIGTKQMISMIENYKNSNLKFESATKELLNNYNINEINEEVLADISGQLFGNQEFIDKISKSNPNIFQKIYSEIKYLWHQFKGYKNQNQFVEDLYYKWTQAYNSNNKLNETSNYYIETVEDFNETEYNNIIEEKLNNQEYAILKSIINSDSNIKPGINYIDVTNGRYTVYYKGFDEFKVMSRKVDVDAGKINPRNDTTGRKNRYSRTFEQFTRNQGTTTSNDEISNINTKGTRERSRSNTSGSTNIKNEKYSIKESENNSGSFNLKQKQLDIINKSNPMQDDYHTGIRKIEDIKTFEETLQDSDWQGYNIFNPDYTFDMANEAIKTGEIIVYSSYPIKQGVFVSPSYMEAESYSKNGKVYEKTVKLKDIAWIDPTQGQYAKINNNNYSLPTRGWQQYLDDNFKPIGTRTNLQDIKLPIFDNNIKMATKEYFENKKMKENLTDADYEILNKVYEKEGKTEILTEKKKAKLLEKYVNDKYAFKDSLDLLAQKLVNKGHYIDKLANEAHNQELKFIYDKNLNSFAEGQYVVGVAQTDNKGNKIGKSINEIWKPIEDNNLTKEFSEYLLHKHNIDRSEKHKYIFGEEIGPAESTSITLELENKYPKFKEYAKDIKEFNHNNLINMKDAGLITQETIDYIESMYPNYITISRDFENSLYVGNNDKTGTKLPLKKATGGNSDIRPLKDTMAEQVIRIKRIINQNELGKELAKTLQNANIDNGVDTTFAPTLILGMDTMVETDGTGNKYYIFFENGKQQKLKINDNLYESLKPTEISRIEKTIPLKIVQKASSIHRNLLTSNNPIFIVNNFFKDFGDAVFNSKYSSKFIKNYGKALNEIVIKGKYYDSYMSNGGMSNTYFDYNEGIKKRNKFVEKIRNANEIIEQLPRLTEFISTLEDGKSLNEALYNAADITTNFKRGGDITKALNRNGFNFLNASIQGLDKQFRNISGQNGIKGYVNLMAKATITGILPTVLNHILLSDDEDYQDLPQSDKDLYFLFKCEDGKFIRIPKGRVVSIFGAVARRTLESIKGQDDAWEGFGSTIINQIGPNNPREDNILAPITQVMNNKTWYGGELISSRLQKELPKNQYDETTDEFSKWLGEKLNISPKKINYLIDQYSGGVGDIILPMITPQAKQNVFIDKFITDSVLKNKNVSKFYKTLEKQTQIANDSFATDEDELQLKYLTGISKEMGDLYKSKKEVQMSKISNKEKTEKVRKIQSKINELAEKALNNYKGVSQDKNSSKIGDTEYYKNSKGEWTVLSDEEKDKNTNISTESYSDFKQKIYNQKNKKVSKGELKKNQDLKIRDKIQILLDSEYAEKEKKAIYENYIMNSNDKEYKYIDSAGIDFKEYLKYKQQDFTSDKEDNGTLNGKTVSKSKQKKVETYLNSMKINGNQRLLLYAINGYSITSSQKSQLTSYVSGLKLSKDDKLSLYDKFSGFTVYKDGKVIW